MAQSCNGLLHPNKSPMSDPNLSSFIWSVADLLRGDYKQSEYGKVILPFTALRRLDCVLEPTKAAVLAEQAARKKQGLNAEPFLLRNHAFRRFRNTYLRNYAECPEGLYKYWMGHAGKDMSDLYDKIKEDVP